MAEYLVTARKWRPMVFEDVVGQEHVTTTLRNALRTGRLAHAYLFSGPRGVGKTTTARLLAKAVNCLDRRNDNPDNLCDHCVEITEGRSFDVLEIDGASNRGVEEIRNLRESVRYAPAKARFKVYIIDEVHMLTKEAFNALLKTLEEPPAHVLFIFATTEIHKVPATILSRCQRFDFRRIAVQTIVENLRAIAREEGLTFDEEALMLVARRGDGSLRDAQSMFDQVVALCGRTVTQAQILEALNIVDTELYFRVTDLIVARDARGTIALVDHLMTRGYDIREFLTGLLEHLRNILIAKTTGEGELIEASDVMRKKYEQVAGHFSIADLLRFQRLIGGTEAAMRFTIQPRFRLEADLVQLVTLPRAVEVGELLQQLEELKKKLPPDGFVRASGVTASSARSDPPLPPPSPGSQPVQRPVSPPPAKVPSSPGSGTLALGEVKARWQEFVEEVRRAKIALGSTMDGMEPLDSRNGVIRISCAEQFQVDALARGKELLSDVVFKVFGVRMRVTGEVGGAGSHHPAADEADEHPVIKAMRRELGAEPI
jgi:DNA polymerase-3 subunit gamma/tau